LDRIRSYLDRGCSGCLVDFGVKARGRRYSEIAGIGLCPSGKKKAAVPSGTAADLFRVETIRTQR
jgi:hypothetical protein